MATTTIQQVAPPHSLRGLRWAAWTSLAMSVAIVVGGGIVRLTGSGLGCPEWPTCVDGSLAPTREMGLHGVIEFGNRLLTGTVCLAVGWSILAARRALPRSSNVNHWAWAQFWIVVLNAIVGGITVWARLSPYVVAAHFVAATLLVAAATITLDKVQRLQNPSPPTPRRAAGAARLAAALLGAVFVLILLGTIVTGAGPHAGDSAAVHRMPVNWTLVTYLHSAVALVVLSIASHLRWMVRDSRPVARRVDLFIGVLIAQGAVGLAQSLTSLPEVLVGLHLLGAVLVWIGAIRVSTVCSDAEKDGKACFEGTVIDS